MVSSLYADNREWDSARLLLLSPPTPIPNSPFGKIPCGNQCVLSDTQEGTKDLGGNWKHTDLEKSRASRRRENWGRMLGEETRTRLLADFTKNGPEGIGWLFGPDSSRDLETGGRG